MHFPPIFQKLIMIYWAPTIDGCAHSCSRPTALPSHNNVVYLRVAWNGRINAFPNDFLYLLH